MDRSDEPSAFAWIMSGTVAVVVAGGLGKFLLDRRQARAEAEAREALEAAAAAERAEREAEQSAGLAESEGHPS